MGRKLSQGLGQQSWREMTAVGTRVEEDGKESTEERVNRAL